MVGEAEKFNVFGPDKNFEILVIIITVLMLQFNAKSLIFFKGKRVHLRSKRKSWTTLYAGIIAIT